jgi:hypothetical protein
MASAACQSHGKLWSLRCCWSSQKANIINEGAWESVFRFYVIDFDRFRPAAQGHKSGTKGLVAWIIGVTGKGCAVCKYGVKTVGRFSDLPSRSTFAPC